MSEMNAFINEIRAWMSEMNTFRGAGQDIAYTLLESVAESDTPFDQTSASATAAPS